jgi:hypothetical protein
MSDLITLEQVKAGKIIETKTYIPFVQKKALIKSIVNACIVEEDGITKIDYAMKQFVTEYSILLYYTNLDLADIENQVAVYDELKESMILDNIIESINKNEYLSIINAIDAELKQKVQIENSVGRLITKGIDKIVSTIPDSKEIGKLLNKAKRTVNNFNEDKYKNIKSIAESVGIDIQNKDDLSKAIDNVVEMVADKPKRKKKA